MRRLARFIVAAMAVGAAPAHANPIDAFGFGARGPAMGNAQSAAAADVSANYHNPAILATFSDIRIDVGYQYARPTMLIDDRDVEVNSSRGMALGLTAPGRIGSAKVAFGGALFIPDRQISRIRTLNSQQPRFQLYDNRPQRLFLAANLAAQITDRLFIGGGIAYMSSTEGGVTLVGRIGFPDAEDSNLDIAIDVDLKTVRYGQFGMLYHANDWLDIAASFRTGFKVTLDQEFIIRGDVGPDGAPPVVENGYLSLISRAEDLFQPAQLTFGFDAQVTSRLTLAFDATYHRWSAFTNPAARIDLVLDIGDFNALLDIPDAPPLADPNFSDTLVPRVGLEWLASSTEDRDWLVRAGYIYEPTPVPEQFGETNFIDNDRHTVSLGGGLTLRHIGEVIRLPASFDAYVAVTMLESRTTHKLSAADPIGDYEASGHVVQAGLGSRWRF